MHEVCDAHDTPSTSAARIPRYDSRGIDQPVPFQRSTSGTWPFDPAATHRFLPTHDTELNLLCRCNARGTVGWVDQLIPLQRCTNALYDDCPTATHAVGEMHDTPLNATFPAAVGVGWTDHPRPSHRSTNANSTDEQKTAQLPMLGGEGE